MSSSSSEVRIIAEQKLLTPYVIVKITINTYRPDLSHSMFYIPPIKEIIYADGVKYLFPTVRKYTRKIEVREGTVFAVFIVAHHSRKHSDKYFLITVARSGAEIKHEHFTVSNAELIRMVDEELMEETELAILNAGYKVSRTYHDRNIAAWLILKEIQQYSIDYDSIYNSIVKQLKKLPAEYLERLQQDIEELLKKKHINERIASLGDKHV